MHETLFYVFSFSQSLLVSQLKRGLCEASKRARVHEKDYGPIERNQKIFR